MSENYQGLITITDLTDNKSCEISGVNVFKYDKDGEIASSSSITLTATLSENVSGGNWQYKNSSGNFVNFSPAKTSSTLTINHTDSIFNDDIAIIKKLTNDSSVFDIFTITKIRDGLPGDALIDASLSNDNQTIPCDENGVPFQSAFPVSSKITVYEGTEDITNEYSISATIQSDSDIPRLIGSISGSTFTAASWNTLAQSYYTATVTFTCTRSGYAPISKILTLSKINTGSSPNYYELAYDILATNKNISNIFNPSSVTFRANHITGETIEDYQGYLKLYRIKLDGTQQTITTSDMSSDSSGGYKYTYTFLQTLDADTKYLSAELYKTGGVGDCLDKQSIVVTSDGQTGASPINVILGNVADVIPCDVNGKLKTDLIIDIPFTAYKGASQVSATITKSNITTRPSNLTDSNITITSSTASSSGSVQFRLYANSELGSNSGEITLTFTCDENQVPMKYSWSKSIQAPPGQDGHTPYIGQNGNWWINGQDTGRSAEGDDGHSPYVDDNTGTWWEWDASAVPPAYHDTEIEPQGPQGIQGVQGETGEQGPQGADGSSISIVSTTVNYQKSSSGTTVPTGTWLSNPPTLSAGEYLWTRSTVAFSDSTTVVSYSIGYHGEQGPQGSQGETGEQGPQGETGEQGPQGSTPTIGANKYWYIDGVSTGIKAEGTDGDDGTPIVWKGSLASAPSNPVVDWCYRNTTDGKVYIYNGSAWVLMTQDGEQGPQGEQGVQGVKGDDGVTYYTWVKYADTPNSGMSDNPTGKAYMGIAYNKTTSTESTSYSDYSWSLIKGADGQAGSQGVKGDTGATGNGISSISYYYKTTTTQTAPSASSITGTTMPTLSATDKYLWQKEIIAYTSGPPQTTVMLLAVYGDKGDEGPQGVKGEPGYNTATIFLYKRSAESVTIDWTNDLVYNFANKALTSLPDGWSDSIPSGSNPLYVTSAVAYSNTTTDTIPYTDWKTPSIMAESGETGISVISATRYYQLSPAQPELPDPPVSPPGGDWQSTEPSYSSGNTSLWYVDVSVFSDDSVQYSDVGRAYSYQIVNDTKALAQTINENYIRWDATHQTLINTENREVVDTIARYLSAYMQFTQTTDEGNPLLLLGDGTGAFVTAVSNKGMRFYQDTTIEEIKDDMEQSTSTKAIAYFDNNQMKINRGVVVNRLQVGKFRWDSQPNDNLMFRWIGQ